MGDTYKTISAPSDETLYKEKGSKFIGYAFPVSTEDQVKEHLEQLRKQHRGAVHFCYAWQMGAENPTTRANDDGEPSNSAGMPILGQLQHYHLTDVLVVVVRFFGGVKLGVGGLMSAYKISAQLALDASEIIEKTIERHFTLAFDYKDINKVMRVIRERQYRIVSQDMSMACTIGIAVRRRDAEKVADAFSALYEVAVKPQ